MLKQGLRRTRRAGEDASPSRKLAGAWMSILLCADLGSKRKRRVLCWKQNLFTEFARFAPSAPLPYSQSAPMDAQSPARNARCKRSLRASACWSSPGCASTSCSWCAGTLLLCARLGSTVRPAGACLRAAAAPPLVAASGAPTARRPIKPLPLAALACAARRAATASHAFRHILSVWHICVHDP
jgi:hypothetical protein